MPSAAHASNVLNNPRSAPQALPFLHLAALPTIDDLTLPFPFAMQHTAAFGFPQIDAFSHFMMSLRHGLSGMSAVRLAAFRALFTHFVYLPCVWPSRVQPQAVWTVARACSMDVVSGHFALTHSAKAGVRGAESRSTVRVVAKSDVMSFPPGAGSAGR